MRNFKKREQGWIFNPADSTSFVVAFLVFTPEGLHSTAQGREAHPGVSPRE